MRELIHGLTISACAGTLYCSNAQGHARNSEILVEVREISARELEITLRNPTSSADTIHHLTLALDQREGGRVEHCCWAHLVPESKALVAGEEYRFTAVPDTLEWCRDRAATGQCIFRPLLDVARPGDYVAHVYQHKDARDTPTSNGVRFRVVAP